MCNPPAFSAVCSHIALSWLMFLKRMSVLITWNMLMSPGTQQVGNPLPTSIGRHHPLHPLKWLYSPPHADRNCHFHETPLLQISCCWQKFTGCFQALIYDLCIYFLHSDQHSQKLYWVWTLSYLDNLMAKTHLCCCWWWFYFFSNFYILKA